MGAFRTGVIQWEQRRKIMRLIRITYDPEGDILYVTFGQPLSRLLAISSQTSCC